MGVPLPKPVDTKLIDRAGSPLFKVGSGCMNGYRDNMEDAHAILIKEDWGFFGVFDGHVNDECSEYIAQKFTERMQTESVPMSEERMKALCLSLDYEYLATGGDGGSTGTFCIVRKLPNGKFDVMVGNVGDSRVIACKDGVCVPLTNDHKPGYAQENQRIFQCHGTVENNRVDGSLAVSRAFGDVTYKAHKESKDPALQVQQKVIALPEVQFIELSAGDFLLLCCDGVFEGDFPNEDVVQYVRHRLPHAKDLAKVACGVCDEAVARNSKDNISCMIVQLVDGSNYVAEQGGHAVEYFPGSFLACNSTPYRQAYFKMSAKAGITPAKALQLRFEKVKELIRDTLVSYHINEPHQPIDFSKLNEQTLIEFVLYFSDRSHENVFEWSRAQLLDKARELHGDGHNYPPHLPELIKERDDVFRGGPQGDQRPEEFFDLLRRDLEKTTSSQPRGNVFDVIQQIQSGSPIPPELLQYVMNSRQHPDDCDDDDS